MSRFYIVNEKRFPLNVEDYTNADLLPYHRWEHRVTIGYNGRRFFVMLDNLKHSIYIEEMTTRLEEIEDEDLWKSLFAWATEKGFLNVMPPLLKPKIGKANTKRFV